MTMHEWMQVAVWMKDGRIKEIEDLEQEGWEVHEVLPRVNFMFACGSTNQMTFLLKRDKQTA